LFLSFAVEDRRRAELLARAGLPPDPEPDRRTFRERVGDLHSSRTFRLLAVAAGLCVGSVVAGLPGALAGVCAAVALPIVVRRRTLSRRQERVESQLSDAVGTIAAGLRAGHSLAQAIAIAAADSDDPLGPALHDVIDRTALGVSFVDSLETLAQTLPGPDVRLAASVLGLHSRTGGDLPGVLDQLVRTLRERRAGVREIRSLTAQARLSGAILGLLPIGFFLFLSATQRSDLAAAYHSPVGVTAIALGLTMQAGAFLWIRRLLRVES
jgi:tight adherence protein B